ncbi:MAG: DoxX family membrane protein [Sinobacteraceae bacterium]|nr:DoxX family membrane protein [Nevskiaceae bacterium]
MRTNPFFDALQFLIQPAWTTAIYWLLVLGSIVIAIYVWRTLESQHSGQHVTNWLCRFFVGSMWWQQTLWKLPPLYTDNPSDPVNTGLHYWMTQMGNSAAIPAQADFVNHVVIPHFYFFAPIVYALEVLTAVSLLLGVFVRFWALIGALQILNLWLGLYRADGEWPWTYFFLLLLQVIFTVHKYGRSLGLDALIVDRSARRQTLNGGLSRLLLKLT